MKLRTKAKQSANNFEVNFFKLMNNSVFGKTPENITNMVDIRLISSDKVAQNLPAKPNFDRCMIFDENLIAVQMKKTKLYFNEPFYLGMSILDLNNKTKTFITTILRLSMGIRQNYSSPTLTLSLMKFKTKNLYKDINPDIEKRSDTSDYPTNPSIWN